MKYKLPKWNRNTPDIIKAISDTYLLKPQNALSSIHVHDCTLLGHKVRIDGHKLKDNCIPSHPSITITYSGWDQTERAFLGDIYGTKQSAKASQTFEIGNPDFGDQLDQFFYDIGLPVLYTVDHPKQKEANTHTYDLKQARKWRDGIPGSEMRPATHEEIASVPPGCLAIFMNCQIGSYGCTRVEQFRDGLWERIQHTTPVEIWADRNFNTVVCFLRAFLPAKDRLVGVAQSPEYPQSREKREKEGFNHKDGCRSRKNTYSAYENE